MVKRKNTMIAVPNEVLRDLKILALINNKTQKDMLIEIITTAADQTPNIETKRKAFDDLYEEK